MAGSLLRELERCVRADASISTISCTLACTNLGDTEHPQSCCTCLWVDGVLDIYLLEYWGNSSTG